MTKKHFEKLASALAQVQPATGNTPGYREGWLASVCSVADACELENVRFDRQRFLSTCGVPR